MMSGVREARRLLAQLRNDDEAAAAAYGSALPSKVRGQYLRFGQILLLAVQVPLGFTYLMNARSKCTWLRRRALCFQWSTAAATTPQVRSQRDAELDELFGSDSDGDEDGDKKAVRRRRPEEGGSQKRSKRKAEEGELLVAKRDISVAPFARHMRLGRR
jgi:hypothetical protein